MSMGDILYVAVVGGRDFPDRQAVNDFLDKLFAKYPDAVIVSGGCPTGVDSFAYDYCIDNGCDILVCGAGFSKIGKAGGPMRNLRIAKICNEMKVWWDGESRGTKNVIEQAKSLGKKPHITMYK